MGLFKKKKEENGVEKEIYELQNNADWILHMEKGVPVLYYY